MAQTTQRIIAQNQSPLTYIFGQTPLMRVEINQGLEEITEIRLRYRIASETAENRVYLQEAMKPQAPDSPVWEAFLPGDYIADYDIEYYFELKLADLA